MKPFIPYSLLAAIAACGLASAQTAVTTPVGYLTTEIYGNTSAGSGGAATLVAPTLLNPVSFASSTSVAPSDDTATFTGGVPTDLDGTYLLEITEGAFEGWWTTVVSSTSTSIVVFDDFPGGLPADTKVSVRKFNTISGVFGAENSANLGASDFIEILDPITQATTVVVYADGWFDLASEAPAEDYIIYPGTAVRVIVQGEDPLTLVTTGEVKTTKTQVDLFEGETWVAQPFAAGGSFGALELAAKVDETDEVILYSEDGGGGQGAETFVSSGGTMFNLNSEAEAEDIVVPDSSGMVIKRPAAGASTITFPAQPIGPVAP